MKTLFEYTKQRGMKEVLGDVRVKDETIEDYENNLGNTLFFFRAVSFLSGITIVYFILDWLVFQGTGDVALMMTLAGLTAFSLVRALTSRKKCQNIIHELTSQLESEEAIARNEIIKNIPNRIEHLKSNFIGKQKDTYRYRLRDRPHDESYTDEDYLDVIIRPVSSQDGNFTYGDSPYHELVVQLNNESKYYIVLLFTNKQMEELETRQKAGEL